MYSSELNTYTDSQLLIRYKQTNDNTCVGILFQRYTHLMMGVCMKYLKNQNEAEDACMQLFEKLLIDLRKHEIQQFKGWLHMVCKNYCLMQLRSDSSKSKHSKQMQKELVSFMELHEDSHLMIDNTKEIQLTYMEECLKGLNTEQKWCVELFFLQEKSYQQVTEITGYTMNNVKSYIQNGKRNLKNCVEAQTTAIK